MEYIGLFHAKSKACRYFLNIVRGIYNVSVIKYAHRQEGNKTFPKSVNSVFEVPLNSCLEQDIWGWCMINSRFQTNAILFL